jgi:hypothetical protein
MSPKETQPRLIETAACPAGHKQGHVRPDRRGLCTRCGAPLQRVVYDASLPTGFVAKSGPDGELVDESGEPVEEVA